MRKAREVLQRTEHERHTLLRRWHREKGEKGRGKMGEDGKDGKLRYEQAVSRDLRATSPVLRRSPEVQQVNAMCSGIAGVGVWSAGINSLPAPILFERCGLGNRVSR